MAQRTFSNRRRPTSNEFVAPSIRPSYEPPQSTEDAQAGLTVTEAADTVTASGTVPLAPITANLSVTEAAQTLTSAVAVSVKGSATVSEAAQTLTGAAGVLAKGTAGITEAAQTVTGAAAVTVAASATITEGAHTLTGSGAVSGAGGVTANASITEAGDTLSADGTVPKAAGGGGGGGSSRSRRPVIIWLEQKRDEPPIPAKPKQTVRRKVEREVRKVTAEVMALEAAPTVADIMDMLEAEARYRDFLAQQANRMRIEALIQRMLEQAANDDEEDAEWLLLAA